MGLAGAGVAQQQHVLLAQQELAAGQFVGVDLGVAPAPDETTVLRFRHLLERHDLGGLMLDAHRSG
jgi:IS5 family transposase